MTPGVWSGGAKWPPAQGETASARPKLWQKCFFFSIIGGRTAGSIGRVHHGVFLISYFELDSSFGCHIKETKTPQASLSLQAFQAFLSPRSAFTPIMFICIVFPLLSQKHVAVTCSLKIKRGVLLENSNKKKPFSDLQGKLKKYFDK